MSMSPPEDDGETDPVTTNADGQTVEEVLLEGEQVVLALPIIGELTFNELHAAQLGQVGVLVGMAYAAGFTEESLLFSLFFVGIPFGFQAIPNSRLPDRGETPLPDPIDIKAQSVIRAEPWYFLLVYVLTFLAGTGVVEVLSESVETAANSNALVILL